jgi:8-oxo-dGTP diphosphatase
MIEPSLPDLIRAAGGLVWRKTPHGLEILLIHRQRYADWSLPKGKLKPGESWQEAALREVLEETGLRTVVGDLAGDVFYYLNGCPKIVLYWNMTVVEADRNRQPQAENAAEVDALQWVSIPLALEQLSYRDERQLVQRASLAQGKLA